MKNRFCSLVLACSGLLAPALAAEGDVRVLVDRRGTLLVLGDRHDNDVFVGRTGKPGEFVVVGRNSTTVNGADEEVVLNAESVKILLHKGDDEAQVDGNIRGNVEVEGGPGNDHLALGDPVVGGTALLSGGGGDDTLDVQDTLVLGGLRLRGGSGDDFVQLFFADVRDRLVIETGSGRDEVNIAQQQVDGFLRLDAGSGDDRFRIADSAVFLDVVLAFGPGDDEVALEENQLGGRLKVAVGSGRDRVSIAATEVADPASFFGGPGRDAYLDAGDNDFQAGPPTVEGFEVFGDI